jgi:hypothetical protein
MFVRKGTVKENIFGYKVVCYDDGTSGGALPYDSSFGKLHKAGGGVDLWLFEKNDELARRLFVEYEEKQLAKLQEKVNKKQKFIDDLKSGVA